MPVTRVGTRQVRGNTAAGFTGRSKINNPNVEKRDVRMGPRLLRTECRDGAPDEDA